jgi:hypothetical protein
VDDVDDLAAVDALEVDGGDPEVRMSQLPLDNVQRDAFARHFDRVSVTKLMRCKPTADPCLDGELAQRRAGGRW